MDWKNNCFFVNCYGGWAPLLPCCGHSNVRAAGGWYLVGVGRGVLTIPWSPVNRSSHDDDDDNEQVL